ncbi:MAG: glycosyltransferase family 2 protein [Nitriliruptoraceae bacterium]
MDVTVTVVIVNHGTGHLLRQCVEAYVAQDHPSLEIVVVDNASDDVTPQVLDELEHTAFERPVTFVRGRTNRGFSGAINDTLARTRSAVVVFSNVDVTPEPTLVSRAVASLLVDSTRGSVQPLLLRQGTAGTIDTTGHVVDRARLVHNRGEGTDWSRQFRAGQVFGVSGALAVHRRAMLEDVAWGGDEVLTEDLFAFFEDVELDWRARRLGWTAWFEPAAVAWHERGGHAARRSRRVEVLNQANRLLVILTCDDLRDVIRHLHVVSLTTVAKFAVVAVTRPTVVFAAFGRLVWHLPGALRRRRRLAARARISTRALSDRWVEPFHLRAWVRRSRARSS